MSMLMPFTGLADPMFTPADWALQPFNPMGDFINQDLALTAPIGDHLRRVAARDQRLLSPIANADLIESGSSYDVWVDVPGVEDIEVDVTEGILSISADRKHTYEKDTAFTHKIERAFGKVQRRITLPTNANGDLAKATYKNGVLQVTIPKIKNTGVKRSIAVDKSPKKKK